MFEKVRTALRALRAAVASVNPDALDGPGAVRLLEAGEEIERLGGTIKLLAYRRLEQTRAWQREGDPTTADFVARKTGTTVGDARAALQTARRLDPLSVTADALRAGELTTRQAEAITDAVAADPHAEKDLVAKATKESLPALRDQCRRIKAAAREDEIAHHDEFRRTRFLRTWTDGEGAGRGEWKLPPEDHARVVARVTAELNAVVAEAKAAGVRAASAEAHAADALVRMAEADAGPGGTRAVLHLRVDQSAFERGTTAPGEICEIEGVGPVPVATARNLSTRAVVRALVVDGTDLSRYANLGRTIPTALEVALEERDPVCVELGCNVRDHLEIHHKVPVADGGVTSLENLERRCRWHHYLATHHPDRAPPDELRLAG